MAGTQSAKFQDSRRYTRDVKPEFVKNLKEGPFKEFLKFVKDHEEELALCFRGKDDMVSIYRNNHIVWDLYDTPGQNKVSISFDHARFCENWDSEILDQLETWGFKSPKREQGKELVSLRKKKGSNSYSFNMESVCRTERDKKKIFDKICVEKSYQIIERIHKTYEDTLSSSFEGERTNYFARYYLEKHPERKAELGRYLRSKPNDLLEKKVQQDIFIHNHETENGMMVYDMEFAQPEIDGIKFNNEPDMLGIRYEGGEPKAIVLIEIKCMRSACLEGKSRVESHLKGMKEYLGEAEEAGRMSPGMQSVVGKVKEHRREEARKILESYQELGLRHLGETMRFDSVSSLPFEIMFVFTHESYGLLQKDDKQNILKLFPETEYDMYDSMKDKDIPIKVGMETSYAVIKSKKSVR